MIAYESGAVASFDVLCQEYIEKLSGELDILKSYFADKSVGINLRFRLIFVPMNKKIDVIESFDEKLVPFL